MAMHVTNRASLGIQPTAMATLSGNRCRTLSANVRKPRLLSAKPRANQRAWARSTGGSGASKAPITPTKPASEYRITSTKKLIRLTPTKLAANATHGTP